MVLPCFRSSCTSCRTSGLTRLERSSSSARRTSRSFLVVLRVSSANDIVMVMARVSLCAYVDGVFVDMLLAQTLLRRQFHCNWISASCCGNLEREGPQCHLKVPASKSPPCTTPVPVFCTRRNEDVQDLLCSTCVEFVRPGSVCILLWHRLAVKDWPHTAELVRSRVFIAQHGASTAQKEPLTQIRRKWDISTLSLIFYVPGLAGSIGASESF